MTSGFQSFDLLPAQIAVLDRQGAIVFTNEAWEETADRQRMAKRDWNYLQECAAAAERGCADGREIGEGIGKILGQELDEFVATYSCPFDRRHHWFQISVRRPRASDQGIGAIVMHTNITSLQHDHLTRLANRALFEAQSQYVLEMARENASAAGWVLIDLNGFKPVNDQFGHAVGDGAGDPPEFGHSSPHERLRRSLAYESNPASPRQPTFFGRMSAMGQKPTFSARASMSAKCQERTIVRSGTAVRTWPQPMMSLHCQAEAGIVMALRPGFRLASALTNIWAARPAN